MKRFLVHVRPATDAPAWWPKTGDQAAWAGLDGGGGWSLAGTPLPAPRAREAQLAWIDDEDGRLWDFRILPAPKAQKRQR